MLFLDWLYRKVFRKLWPIRPCPDIPLIVYPYQTAIGYHINWIEIEKALMVLGYDDNIGDALLMMIEAGYVPKLRIVFEELPK